MGIKYKLFLTAIFLVTFFPLFFSPHLLKVEKGDKLPQIELFDGSFKQYNPSLIKEGEFKKAEFFEEEKLYKGKDINLSMLTQKGWNHVFSHAVTYTTRKVYFTKPMTYKSEDYTLTSKVGEYNLQTEVIKGGAFTFDSEKVKGTGKSFRFKEGMMEATDINFHVSYEEHQ